MRAEAAGFSKVAREYERGRPEYPREVVEWIVVRTGLGPGKVVVDLAAGTGKLTRRLVDFGARVIAVEPIPEMLNELKAVLPGVVAHPGTAEDTGLRDGVASVVTVAQAFHWFSTNEALQEIARVLEPAGYLALVWNRRDLTQPLQAEVTRIISAYRNETPYHDSGAWKQVMEETELFSRVDEFHIAVSQVLDADGLADRVASTSFIANLPSDEHDAVIQQVRGLVTGTVELVYDCGVYLYRKT